MVSKDEIRAVAANARLNLTDEDVTALAQDLENILESFESLDDIDTEGVEPSFHPIESAAEPRDDECGECLSQDEALSNTENTDDGYFEGPKAV